MAELSVYYLDVASAKFYDSEGAKVNDLDYPSLFLGEVKQFELHLMYFDTSQEETSFLPYTQLTGLSLGYYLALDDDWVRFHYGKLKNAVSAGAVSTLVVYDLSLASGHKVMTRGGTFTLDNGTDDAETVEYTSYVLANGEYTLTLKAATVLANSYSADDVAAYVDPPLALAIGADIDDSDSDNGVFLVTLDGNTETLEYAIGQSNRLSGVSFEFGGTDVSEETKLLIQGSDFLARNRLYFTGDAPPRSQTNDYYTNVAADALFVAFSDMYHKSIYNWNILEPYIGVSSDPDMVKRNGKIYKALTDNTGQAPESNPTDWEDISASGGGGGDNDKVGVSSNDTTPNYLFEKVDQSQFEEVDDAGDESISIKDDGLPIAKTAGLQTELDDLQSDIDDKADASAVDAKLDKDWSAFGTKTTIDGTEYLLIDIGGVKYKIPTDLFAQKGHEHDFDLEHGIDTPASEITNFLDGVRIIAIRDLDTADLEVIALYHADGYDADTNVTDSSTYDHTPALVGAGAVLIRETPAKFGSVFEFPGDAGWDLDVDEFDPQDTGFEFNANLYLTDANKLNDYGLIHIGTGGDTVKVFKVSMEGGSLVVKLGLVGFDAWAEEHTYNVVDDGIFNADDYNNILVQWEGNNMFVGMNGILMDKIPMTNKTLKTPDPASKIRFGYDYDGSSRINYLEGFMDEFYLTAGASYVELGPTDILPSIYTQPDELFVTKKYDIDPNEGEDGVYRLTFTDADLTAGILTVNHNLNKTINGVFVYDANGVNGQWVLPDQTAPVDADSLTIDLTSHQAAAGGAIVGSWRIVVLSGAGTGGASGGGGESNTASNLGAGADVFKQKSGVDLEMRSIESSDSSATITEGASTIDIVVPADASKADKDLSILDETGAPYTLDDADAGSNLIKTDDAITIPTGLTVGKQFLIFNEDVAANTLTTTGVTVKGSTDTNISPDGIITVLVIATDTVLLKGDTE